MAKGRKTKKTRRDPIRLAVRRLYADRYLLITLLSFAGSISFTRLFLFLTGYPQIGSGELHIAHVVWGGLFLFVAGLLPLTFANRSVLDVSAFLNGVGVGLFIDEVGKFITSQNNYFFPWAAPIIYAVFLLTLLVYHQVRKQRHDDPRTNSYHVLDELQDVVDRDLSAKEKEEILDRLQEIKSDGQQVELTALAENLIRFLNLPAVKVVQQQLSVFDQVRDSWLHFEATVFSRSRHRWLLWISLFIWSLWGVIHPYLSWYTSFNHLPMPGILGELINNRLILSTSGIGFVEFHLGLEVLVGIILLIGGFLFLFGKERTGSQICIIDLLFSLCVVYLLVFYYDQFSSIVYTALQFLLLMGCLRYRTRFLTPK